MAFQTGKSGYFSWNNGSERDLSTFISECSLERSIDEIETTTMSATSKTFLVGLLDNTISISGFYDPTATTGPDAVLNPDFIAGTSRTWIYGPYGSTASNVKYTGTGYVTKYNIKGGVGGAVEYEADFRITGAVTRTTF